MKVPSLKVLSQGESPVYMQVGSYLNGRRVVRASVVQEGTKKVQVWQAQGGEVLAVFVDKSQKPTCRSFGKVDMTFHQAIKAFRGALKKGEPQ